MDRDPAIEPDTKNWTWVLERPCPDCSFDAASIDVRTTGALIRGNAAAWDRVLQGTDVRRRPAPSVWSALEYGCHVRDVFVLFDRRLELMLAEDDPRFENWDQDATAVESDYGAQDPHEVRRDLVAAADRLATRFDGVRGPQWERPGRRSDGAVFTVESFARYLLHDPIHHLWDVTPR
jgi:DinB superfamily